MERYAPIITRPSTDDRWEETSCNSDGDEEEGGDDGDDEEEGEEARDASVSGDVGANAGRGCMSGYESRRKPIRLRA